MNKATILISLLTVSFCLLLFCIGDYESVDSPVIRIQKWNLAEPNSSNHAEININTHENGSMSCDGIWYYDYVGTEVTCNDLKGSVYKDTTFLSINCNGTASYIDDYGLEITSGFYLKIRGQFKDELSSGNWEISFDEAEWNDYSPRGRVFKGDLIFEKTIAH